MGETNREHSVKTKVKVRRKKEATRTSQADDDVMIDSVKVAEKIDVSAAIQEALIQVKEAREAAEAANTKAAASALEMERRRRPMHHIHTRPPDHLSSDYRTTTFPNGNLNAASTFPCAASSATRTDWRGPTSHTDTSATTNLLGVS